MHTLVWLSPWGWPYGQRGCNQGKQRARTSCGSDSHPGIQQRRRWDKYIYPSNLQAILVICGISCQITLCSACSHRLTPWHSPTSDLCLLSCPNVLCISIQLTPPEHLDWKIFSQDYDTDRGYFRSEWLWCLGCGAQAEMLGWVCWVPTEGPERRRSNPADILSKQRIAAKASEMAENTECCASYLRAEHAPSQLSVHRNIESFNRIPQG